MPLGHWGFLMREMQWLANDMAQVRDCTQPSALSCAKCLL